MNYIVIDNNKYNLTNDGIGFSEESLLLTIVNDNYSFDDIFDVFKNIGNLIVIYGTIENGEDFESGKFEGYTQLKGVNYDLEKNTFTVHLIVPNEVSERLDEIEGILNGILMEGGI